MTTVQNFGFGTQIRKSPYFDATVRWGATAFSVYNHMYIPRDFGNPEQNFWNLINDAILCDVAVERQVEIAGPDAARFVQMLTPRDLSKLAVGQCKYVLITDAQGGATPRLAHRSTSPMNPASTMKLVTTIAALDLLGPAYTWTTPVYLDGTVQNGVLNGSLYLKGQGDPKLVMERLWLLMRRVQGMGIKTIAGDIVLDRSALEVPEPDPAKFDGEPLRPYNVAPDAMLLNFKSVVMTFTPDRSANLAYVQYDPPLAGVSLPATVALNTTAAECGDYRGALKADFSDPLRIRLAGAYPAACGERSWRTVLVASARTRCGGTLRMRWPNRARHSSARSRTSGFIPPLRSRPSAMRTVSRRRSTTRSCPSNCWATTMWKLLEPRSTAASRSPSFSGRRAAWRTAFIRRFSPIKWPVRNGGARLRPAAGVRTGHPAAASRPKRCRAGSCPAPRRTRAGPGPRSWPVLPR